MDVLLSLTIYLIFVLIFFLLFYYLRLRIFGALVLAVIISLLLLYLIEPLSQIPKDTPNSYMALYVVTVLASLLLVVAYILYTALTERDCPFPCSLDS